MGLDGDRLQLRSGSLEWGVQKHYKINISVHNEGHKSPIIFYRPASASGEKNVV